MIILSFIAWLFLAVLASLVLTYVQDHYGLAQAWVLFVPITLSLGVLLLRAVA
jgi:hypothetical protein